MQVTTLPSSPKKMLYLSQYLRAKFPKIQLHFDTGSIPCFFFFIPDLISVALEDDRSLRSPLGVLTFKERLIKWKILLQTAGSLLRKPHSHLAVFRLFSCSHPVIFILGAFCETF